MKTLKTLQEESLKVSIAKAKMNKEKQNLTNLSYIIVHKRTNTLHIVGYNIGDMFALKTTKRNKCNIVSPKHKEKYKKYFAMEYSSAT
jgi:hypothetical protein